MLLLALVMSAVALLVTSAATGASASANLDQCANGQAPSPSTDGCDVNASDWVNGNLGASKTVYFEGDSIPYRLKLANLGAGSHTVTIEWDTTKSGEHALDYLTSFNSTVASANPCLGVSGCSPSTFTTFAIPKDPQVDNGSGSPITQIGGNFRLYGGSITGVSDYSYPNGTGFSGDKSARITITFTASAANPVLAWGGHIATRPNWGLGNSAVAITGSPYHTRLIGLDGSGGNQDRSLAADAVIFPGSITVNKDAVPNDPQNFSFSTTGGLSPASFLLDDDSDPTLSNTQSYAGITNFTTYTFSEAATSGWTLTFGTPPCTVTSPNGGSQSTSSSTLTVNLKEGENVNCTFTNTRQAAHLIVIKHVVNDNGGTKTASDFTMTAAGTAVPGGTTSFAGAESPGTDLALAPGGYSVSEASVAGYTQTSAVGDCSGTIAAGQTKTCTITNDDIQPKLHVIKSVTNDNGGTKTPSDFTVHVKSGGTDVSGSPHAGEGSPGTLFNLNGGTYAVSENDPSSLGYSQSSIVCAGQSTSSITLQVGDDKTCTITNDDQAAHLIVIKHVVNDNGGSKTASDFTMTVGGVTASGGNSFAGAESPGTNKTLTTVGSYNVTESGPPGYTESDSADCTGSIALGQTKTCTVTNDDQAAHLIVIKHVTNDNGLSAVASDFTMTIGGVTASGGNSFTGAESPGTDKTLTTVGSYNVTETGPTGYDASFSSDCTATIALGETKTCTVTNDDTKSDSSTATAPWVYPNDSTTITGRAPVGGQARFDLFDPSDPTCGGDPIKSWTVDVVDGSASTSNTSFAATTVGTWHWQVTYLGDGKNNGSASDCGVEKFTIGG